ncbi:hypothetical protein SLEP1_g24774 [Rubroshorea leprosula]|uniref:SAP domain-containing protein n=1 Tax=Rubroshorea leprosula TaxID=152421 RepID=A0AAV5JS81_9ROSI|nr:hypothetical protein SLEP1_g24774 [Rubroshorea leprosula]
MESSSSLPYEPNQTTGGASKFLANLPSRGLFSSTILSSNLGGMRVYICEHNTSPPEGQKIQTNQQNILIRSLLLNGKKGDSSSKDVKTAPDGHRKRPSERAIDTRASAKKANTNISRPEGSNGRAAENNFQNLTVERLRALLKEKGLSPKGRKDELVERLRSLNN